MPGRKAKACKEGGWRKTAKTKMAKTTFAKMQRNIDLLRAAEFTKEDTAADFTTSHIINIDSPTESDGDLTEYVP